MSVKYREEFIRLRRSSLTAFTPSDQAGAASEVQTLLGRSASKGSPRAAVWPAGCATEIRNSSFFTFGQTASPMLWGTLVSCNQAIVQHLEAAAENCSCWSMAKEAGLPQVVMEEGGMPELTL